MGAYNLDLLKVIKYGIGLKPVFDCLGYKIFLCW